MQLFKRTSFSFSFSIWIFWWSCNYIYSSSIIKLKPLGVILKIFFDEVYQAALAAGSGGIRWNSENRYIQLMDENKNWINYRKFDPNAYYIFKSNEIDISNGWLVFKEANGRATISNSVLSVGATQYSSGSAAITSTASFDASLYNKFSVIYMTDNTTVAGDTTHRHLCLMSSRATTYAILPSSSGVLVDSIISGSITEQKITLDTSSINFNVYIYIRFGNCTSANNMNISEIYFWNE